LADLAGEVDVLDYALEGGVRLLQRRERLVEPVADVVVDLIAQVLPPSSRRDEERAGVEVRSPGPLLGLLQCPALGQLAPPARGSGQIAAKISCHYYRRSQR